MDVRPLALALNQRAITFQAPDSASLTAWIIPAANAGRDAPWVLISHGNYGNIGYGGRPQFYAWFRDLGVNLAGVEIILNMRGRIEAMQHEVNEFMDYVKRELSRGIGDWEQRLSTALVKSTSTDLVRANPPAAAPAAKKNQAR